MLKILVATVALLAAWPSAAEEVGAKTVERWAEADHVCQLGELKDGTPVTTQVGDRSCKERDKLRRALLKHDYCWSEYEQEWYPIGQDNGFCAKSN